MLAGEGGEEGKNLFIGGSLAADVVPDLTGLECANSVKSGADLAGCSHQERSGGNILSIQLQGRIFCSTLLERKARQFGGFRNRLRGDNTAPPLFHSVEIHSSSNHLPLPPNPHTP